MTHVAQDQLSPLVRALVASDIKSLVADPSSSAYDTAQKSYYATQQQDIKPICFIQPHTAEDISSVIKVLRSLLSEYPVDVAVRSGGWNTADAAANASNGVTIDLRALNKVSISETRETVTVGPGITWIELLRYLDDHKLSVCSGRIGGVGVGGLCLGAGISFHSPRMGFTCDNIISYEVVLADGKLIKVAQSSQYADLWKALKGGGNNFGIVSSIEMRCFEAENIWGGSMYFPISDSPGHLDALYNFTANPDYDEYSSVISVFGFFNGQTAISESFQYTTAPPNGKAPECFAEFMTSTPFQNTNRILPLSEVIAERDYYNPPGFRQLYLTSTFINNREILHAAYDMWNVSIAALEKVEGLTYALIFQPLPPAITSKSKKLGGNMLGLENAPPLMICLLVLAYPKSSDDELIRAQGWSLLDRIEKEAERLQCLHKYKYTNYAAKGQDVIEGYGAENITFMRQVSQKYDPTGFFQHTVSGGFKLPK